MQYVKSSSLILFRRERRRRARQASVMALALIAAGGIATYAVAEAQSDPAFDRLKAPTGLLSEQFGAPGAVYAVDGGGERFAFIPKEGDQAVIQFVCNAEGACPPSKAPHTLFATRTTRGDVVYESVGGVPVMRVAATGGATLLGGARFVPPSVPKAGRAVVPTN